MSKKIQSIVEDIQYYISIIADNAKENDDLLYRLRRAEDKEEFDSLIDSIAERNTDVLGWAALVDNLASNLADEPEEDKNESEV